MGPSLRWGDGHCHFNPRCRLADRSIVLAVVAGAHGIAGEVRLKLFTDDLAGLKAHKAFNGGTLTLAPGTYYFANTLTVQGGAKLIGNGVTLVFSCRASCASVGGEPGKFNFGQGTTVEITAPTTGAYAGMAIMFDPDGSQGTPNQLSGTVTLNGAVYAKKAGFNMGSSSGVIKAWTIVSGGNFDANNGNLQINNTAYYTATGGGSGASSGGSVSLVG